MTLPVTIPNTFANATTSIPLANLDANFVTIYGAVNGIGNGAEALANVTISGGNATFTTANATTIDTTNIEVTNIKAKDGTASVSIADSTGIPTISKATVIETTDNTNAALRITQLGTGNALLVEDSANPDATPFVIDASGNVGIGTTSPTNPLSVVGNILQQRDSTAASIIQSAGGTFNRILQRRSAGTYASPTAVSSGDVIGDVLWQGYDGTGYIQSAVIQAAVDGTPGTNDMPGRITFLTTADGASTVTERARITSDGYLRMSSSSGGIQFNGDTAAANALDDYEEGDWTPSVTSGGGSITAYTSEGKYIKIGKSVYLWGGINITNIGTASGAFFWGGAPFTSFNNSLPTSSRAAVFLVREDAAVGTAYQGFIDENGTTGQVRNFDNSTFAFSNNTTYCFCFTYITT